MGRYSYRTQKPLADRFWSKVEKTATCWLWTAAVDGRGYGVIGLGGKGDGLGRAHRVSWEMANGPIPEGAILCHTCDVKRCVRPDHLYAGTKADNARDAIERGQMSSGPSHPVRRGMDHWKARLSDADVTTIRARRLAGEKQSALAREFGVSEAHVSRLVRGHARPA